MKRTWIQTGLTLMCVAIMTQTAAAEETLSISHNIVKEDQLYVYMENPGSYENVTCQVGLELSPQVTVKNIADPDISINTYILIDNSLSIQEKYRSTMKQVAKDLVYAQKENEKITIATFDTELHYLAENSRDSEALIETVDQIEFQNLDTQVVNVLYSLYEKIEDQDENDLSRIILMSDGVETKTIGYTREELIDKVKNAAYPVYILGCTYKSNETELENMFRISRETNAEYYLLDNVEGADQVASEIDASFDMVQIQAEIPKDQKDGSSKGIKIVFLTANGEKIASFSQTMPFPLRENEGTNETELETEIETEKITSIQEIEEDAISAEVETEKITGLLSENETEWTDAIFETLNGRARWIGLFICAALIASIIVFLISKHKKESKKSELKAKGTEENLKDDKTEWLDEKTEIDISEVITIRLTDVDRPSVIVEYTLVSAAIIGRNAEKSQIVFDYEKSVSSKHCELLKDQNRIFIRDLDSANATYVDGKIVEEKTELSDGSIIKMGRLKVRFQILNQEPERNLKREAETGTEFAFDY